jgi:hypothetical protein
MVTRLLEAVDAHDGVAEFHSVDGLAVWKAAEDGFGETCGEVGFLRVIVAVLELHLNCDVRDDQERRV